MSVNTIRKNKRMRKQQVRLDFWSWCKYLWSLLRCSVMLNEIKWTSANRKNKKMQLHFFYCKYLWSLLFASTSIIPRIERHLFLRILLLFYWLLSTWFHRALPKMAIVFADICNKNWNRDALGFIVYVCISYWCLCSY